MQQESLKVPRERIAVLIGHDGATKREVEKATGAKLSIDSGSGEVEITLAKGDSFALMKATSVIKAIGRGFNPEKSLLLMNDDYTLNIVELEELVGKSEKTINAKKGRVIGESGRARKKIESETSTFISVYGKTIGIIGRIDDVPKARRAIEMLIEGAMHKTAFNFLEHRKAEDEIEF